MQFAARFPFVSVMCVLAACGGTPADDGSVDAIDPATLDDDGDGLTNGEEAALGSDPSLADSDADGLDDAGEVAAGTDLLLADSDGDGYVDPDELHAGTDPLDVASVIYAGGWPYNREKAALENPTFYGSRGAIEEGGQFPDLIGVDQFGEIVHLYDFAGRGSPIVVDFSAQWCGPCMNLSDFLIHGNDSLPYTNIRDAVESGDVYWVTVMSQNIDFDLPTGVTSFEWASSFPDDRVPVLSPPNPAASMHFIDLNFFPTSVWLNQGMKVMAFENNPNPWHALDELEDDLARN